DGSHADATGYLIEETVDEAIDGAIDERGPGPRLTVLRDQGASALADPGQYVGHRGAPGAPEAILLVNHGLHVEIQLDHEHPIGRDDRAGVKDVLVESALSTIMDLEDSVAAVDADDKVAGYRNWL